MVTDGLILGPSQHVSNNYMIVVVLCIPYILHNFLKMIEVKLYNGWEMVFLPPPKPRFPPWPPVLRPPRLPP